MATEAHAGSESKGAMVPSRPLFWIGLIAHVGAGAGASILGMAAGLGQSVPELSEANLRDSAWWGLRIGWAVGVISCLLAAFVLKSKRAAFLWIALSTLLTLIAGLIAVFVYVASAAGC